MTTKNGDRFLTCLDACDTIILLSNDCIFNNVDAARDLVAAYGVVIGTSLSDVPDSVMESLIDLKIAIRKVIGEEAYESFSGSAGSQVLNLRYV